MTTTRAATAATCRTKAKDTRIVPSVFDVAVLASIDRDGKSFCVYLCFISDHLPSLSATPKRQRGRRAQQARAVAAAATTTAATAASSTVTAATTAADTAPASGATTTAAAAGATRSVITGDITPDINMQALPAMANLAGTAATTATITTDTSPVEDDNPFLMSSLYNELVHAEQPSHASQLEDQLRTLSIHSPESSSASQSDADNTSAVGTAHQKGRKEAQDVKAFFREENERWYCKFCE
jgi:hypothetical protein